VNPEICGGAREQTRGDVMRKRAATVEYSGKTRLRERGGGEGIRVGVISPLTGPWTAYGRAHLYGVKLAVEEINDAGGVLGQAVELVVADSQSDPSVAAEVARRLVLEGDAEFLVGTFNSLERNAVAWAISRLDRLLLYPTFYEGQSRETYPGTCNENVFMFGPNPEQQVLPHLAWMIREFGGRFFLVGSDYVWPRRTHGLVREWVRDLGGEVVGEAYLPLGTTEYGETLGQIREVGADVVLHAIAAYDSVAFRSEFRRMWDGGGPALWSINDEEITTARLGPAVSEREFASFDYFMGLAHVNNRRFLGKLRRRFGRGAMMSTVGVGMYNAARMLAVAIEKAGAADTARVREALRGLVFREAPQGEVWMRSEDNQLVGPSFLLRVRREWTRGEDIFEPVHCVGMADAAIPSAEVGGRLWSSWL
jgi:urea transport system substrate-binding protein